ncbi:MAG: hypothetical protein WCY25_08075 [Moheibacter sp.]
MKKIFILFATTLIMVSCQITERVYIQESGAVQYETEVDFSEMIGLMFTEADKDSLRLIGEFPMDSVMKFSDLEKFDAKLGVEGASEAERNFMKVMDKMNVRMVMNDTHGKMIFGIHEKDVNSFNAYMKEMRAATEQLEREDKKAAEEFNQSGLLKTMEFKYNGKTFERIAGNETAGMLEEMDDSTAESTRQMMNMFQYKLEYHFPKKIKKTSIENATYSLDGKIMTVNVPMMELLDKPEKYNFTVEFE